MGDLISRQAVLKLLSTMPPEEAITKAMLIQNVKYMSSAQPEKRTEERTETHACDLISRQAAIDALHMHLMYRMGTDSNKKRLDDWINGVPSAQPEIVMCKDCKKYIDYRCRDEHANLSDWRHEDDYCSYAERREVSE